MATPDHQLHGPFFGGLLLPQPDPRDVLFSVAAPRAYTEVDLRPYFPSQSDQSNSGSCAAHASAKARHFLVNLWREATGQPLLDPDAETFSELWEYFWTRKLMGTFPQDSGSDPRAMCDAMLQYGAVLESDCPWAPSSAAQDIQRDLSTAQFASQQFYGISGYAAIPHGAQALPSIYAALAAKKPVLAGIAVYNSFFQLDGNAMSPMPRRGDQLAGYHEIPLDHFVPDPSVPGGVRVGWRVSWANFGNANGDAYLPGAYLTQYAIDFRTLL